MAAESTPPAATLRPKPRLRPASLSLAAWCLSFAAVPALCQRDGACGAYAGQTLATVPGQWYHRAVEKDYLIVEYNAKDGKTFWHDYKYPLAPVSIERNASFLPVVDTREKIAVHVCGLHFGDQLTVTTNPLAVPEGGADIRGATPPAATASLTAAVDAIQNPAASGNVTVGGSLGYQATTALTPAAVPGIVPGTITQRGTDPSTAQYKDGTVTLSGRQVALLMYETFMNAQQLVIGIGRFKLHPQPWPGAPGSIDAIEAEIEKLWAEIASAHHASDAASAFDEDVNATQILSNDLTSLAATISAQGFGARAVAIHNNYSTLRGILDLSGYGRRNPINGTAAYPGCVPPPVVAPPVPQDTSTLTKEVDQAVNDAQDALAQAKKAQADVNAAIQNKPIPPATPVPAPKGTVIAALDVTCEPAEEAAFDNFNQAYRDELERLMRKTPPDLLLPGTAPHAWSVDHWEPASTFEALEALRQDLQMVDTNAGNVFQSMNEWNRESNVEQTDLIQPATANTLMRVSIIVQRGYVPFTLASAPTPVAVPAITLASAAGAATPTPPSATATTTGTPAHAVKTVLIEVHRVANFNLAGAAVGIHVPTTSYAAVPGTAVATQNPPGVPMPVAGVWYGQCGGQWNPLAGATGQAAAPGYSCIVATQTTNIQLAAMLGIVYYPFGHDYFPRGRGWQNPHRNWLPSFFVGTSVNTLGDAFGGLNWEPITGIDVMGGVGVASASAAPPGVNMTTPLPSGYTLTTGTAVHYGLSFGLGFDLGVFNQLFGKPQAATLP